ncbi:citrate transporter-domain-containing protein [Tribonema minus]|uniref:Citrate transporter-domain-containing protein n=1 Tax=Tribonema minus TaxID=303371 RepID=A0A835Z174_9STRA|nr:citrate transporter-domain-containing protein [Tribonema minus]
MGSVWETAYVAVVIVGMLITLVVGLLTPETVVFIAMLLCWNAGILSLDEALKGFSNSGMLAVGSLFVVVKAVEKTGVVDRIARHVFGFRSSEHIGMVRVCLLVFFLSAWFNNTPLVALFIPIIKDWARMRGFAASTFLMPMCHAVTMGGLLTMIGTSTNLVVDGLVTDNGEPPIGFFEPAYVAGPAGLLCIVFTAVFAVRILPRNGGLFRLVRDRTKDLLTEIEVEPDCPMIGKPITLLTANLNVPLELLVKIRRPYTGDVFGQSSALKTQTSNFYKVTKGNYVDIYPVSPVEPIQAGDIIFLACPLPAMLDLQVSTVAKPIKGIKVLDVMAVDLPGRGTEFVEAVLGSNNKFIGKSVGELRANFQDSYGANVIAVRRLNTSAAAEDFADDIKASLESADVRANEPIHVGDTVLLLAKDDFETRWGVDHCVSGDFFVTSRVGAVPRANRWRDYLPLLIFAGMLAWVTSKQADMVQAAMAAIGVLLVTGCISAKKAVGYVDWALLLLIGSAIGLSKSMENSGLADYVGDAIAEGGLSPWSALFCLYAVTMFITEIVTNNAAAAIGVPLALSIAKALDVSPKPFYMAVLIAASASFITPIGYQTNTMVWAPGGYSFLDFAKYGLPLSIIYAVVAVLLLPTVFPF